MGGLFCKKRPRIQSRRKKLYSSDCFLCFTLPGHPPSLQQQRPLTPADAMLCKRKNCEEQPLTPCKLPRCAPAREQGVPQPEELSSCPTQPEGESLKPTHPQSEKGSLCSTYSQSEELSTCSTHPQSEVRSPCPTHHLPEELSPCSTHHLPEELIPCSTHPQSEELSPCPTHPLPEELSPCPTHPLPEELSPCPTHHLPEELSPCPTHPLPEELSPCPTHPLPEELSSCHIARTTNLGHLSSSAKGPGPQHEDLPHCPIDIQPEIRDFSPSSKRGTVHPWIEHPSSSSVTDGGHHQHKNMSPCRAKGAGSPELGDLSPCCVEEQAWPSSGDVMDPGMKVQAPHCSGGPLLHCTIGNCLPTGDLVLNKTLEHPFSLPRDLHQHLSVSSAPLCVEDQLSHSPGGQTLHNPRSCHLSGHHAVLSAVTGPGNEKSLSTVEHGQPYEDEYCTSKFSSCSSACLDHVPSASLCPVQLQSPGWSCAASSQRLVGEALLPCEPMHVNQLPPSLLLKIFSHLSLNERSLSISLVCRYWRDLCLDLQFWKQLDLSGRQQVKDNLLEKIASRCWNITEINISDCLNVTDAGICTLAMNCSGLVKYTAYRCKQLSDSSLISLATHCPLLQKVHAGNQDRLTDDALKQLGSKCKELRDIHFGQCYKISDEGMVVIAKGCPKLQKIYMQENKLVTNRSVEAFADYCLELQYVGFMGCSVTSRGVIHLTSLKSLSSLDLRHITELDNETVMEIVKKCLNLTSLNLCLNRNIDDRCVEVIAKEGRRLKELYLVTCKITDHALIAIGRYSTSIETVDVGWCKEITDEGAKLIAQSSKSIRYLGLMRCDQVNESTVEQLVQQYPHITFSTVLQDCKRTLERAYQMGWTPNTSSVS